jgi:hypothetical protein
MPIRIQLDRQRAARLTSRLLVRLTGFDTNEIEGVSEVLCVRRPFF